MFCGIIYVYIYIYICVCVCFIFLFLFISLFLFVVSCLLYCCCYCCYCCGHCCGYASKRNAWSMFYSLFWFTFVHITKTLVSLLCIAFCFFLGGGWCFGLFVFLFLVGYVFWPLRTYFLGCINCSVFKEGLGGSPPPTNNNNNRATLLHNPSLRFLLLLSSHSSMHHCYVFKRHFKTLIVVMILDQYLFIVVDSWGLSRNK